MTITAKTVRRVVAGDDETGKAVVLSDSVSPDVHTDPARPGFYATRLWVTSETPARVRNIRETLDTPHTIEPPENGSVFRFYEFPPDTGFIDKVGEDEARAYFAAMGSPGACAWSPDAPHPYLENNGSLEFCYVLDGALTLITETGEAELAKGDVAILRGGAHAWSNRSDQPAVLANVAHHATGAGPAKGDAPLPKSVDLPDNLTRTVRRVLTGHDGDGRSAVIMDTPAPNAKLRPGSAGTYYTEIWTTDQIPADLTGNRDDGWVERPVEHSPPALGARFRVPMPGPRGSHAAVDEAELQAAFDSMNASGMSERRSGHEHWHMHRSRTIDYAIAAEGDRYLVLDDSKTLMHPGDVVIQLGNYHAWEPVPGKPGLMAFDMIGATYDS